MTCPIRTNHDYDRRRFPVLLPATDAPTCPECRRPLTHYGGWSYACVPWCGRGYVVPPAEPAT